MNIREKQEQTELSLLSPYATRSIDTKRQGSNLAL